MHKFYTYYPVLARALNMLGISRLSSHWTSS